MKTKNPKIDTRSREEQIDDNFKEAMKCLKMLRPDDINDKLQYYVDLNLALLELKRLALDEPKIWAIT